MKKGWLVGLLVVVIVLVAAWFVLPVPSLLKGAMHHEPFHAGMPLNYWLDQLNQPDEQKKEKAEDALAAIGEPAVPPLMALVKESGGPQGEAAAALAKMGKSALGPLVKAMKEDQTVRPRGELILQRMGEKAVPAEIELLKENSEDLRISAATNLGLVGPKAEQAVPALIAVVEDKTIDADKGDPPPPGTVGFNPRSRTVRGMAAQALGRIGPGAKAAVPALCEAATDKNWLIRQYSTAALGPICENDESAAKQALPVLQKALNDKERPVWDAAVRSLGRIGAPAKGAVGDLLAVLDRPVPAYQVDAATALGRIEAGTKNKAAFEKLDALYKKSKDDAALRKAVAEAMTKIDPDAAAKAGVAAEAPSNPQGGSAGGK